MISGCSLAYGLAAGGCAGVPMCRDAGPVSPAFVTRMLATSEHAVTAAQMIVPCLEVVLQWFAAARLCPYQQQHHRGLCTAAPSPGCARTHMLVSDVTTGNLEILGRASAGRAAAESTRLGACASAIAVAFGPPRRAHRPHHTCIGFNSALWDHLAAAAPADPAVTAA